MKHWLAAMLDAALCTAILLPTLAWCWCRQMAGKWQDRRVKRQVVDYELERLYPVETYEKYAPKGQSERLDVDRLMGMPIVRSLPPRQYQPK